MMKSLVLSRAVAWTKTPVLEMEPGTVHVDPQLVDCTSEHALYIYADDVTPFCRFLQLRLSMNPPRLRMNRVHRPPRHDLAK